MFIMKAISGNRNLIQKNFKLSNIFQNIYFLNLLLTTLVVKLEWITQKIKRFFRNQQDSNICSKIRIFFWSRRLYGGHDEKIAFHLNSWISTTDINYRRFSSVFIDALSQCDIKTTHTHAKIDYFSSSTSFFIVYTRAKEVLETLESRELFYS